MRVIITQYPVYNLWIQRPFELEGYAFTPTGGMVGYQERLRVLLATPEDSHTVDVVRQAHEGDAPPAARLWESGCDLDDILTLLSVGQGRSVHYKEARWATREGDQVVASGVQRQYTGRALLRGEQAVSPFEVEPYLQQVLARLQTPGWPEDTGFAAGAFWYLESLAVPHYEQRYLSAWHGLLALVRRYFQQHPRGAEDGRSPAELVLAYRDAHEYDFVLEEHPSMWEELSQDFLARHPRDRIFSPRHAYIFARKLQLVLLMALLHLAGSPDFARRASLIRDIRR